MSISEIPLNQIHPSAHNPRTNFNENSLKELADSIRQNGVLQPVLARKNSSGYELIAGERRLRASLMAGLATIPARVVEATDEEVLRWQIVENMQRENVHFMDEAAAVKRLRDECSLDISEISRFLGKSPAHVSNLLLLCNLSDEAQRIARENKITRTVAYWIARLNDPEQQSKAARDLARASIKNRVSETAAKSYIAKTFHSATIKRNSSSIKKEGMDFIFNWKKYLVNFDSRQFEEFKQIVRGRTETDVLAEAVDLVMRRQIGEAKSPPETNAAKI